MPHEIVTALYKPKAGMDEALQALIARHVPTLRRLRLVTDRPAIVMRSFADGTYVEIFEWVSGDAAQSAHEAPEVQALWEELQQVAVFSVPAELLESTRTFPHFEPMDALCS